jgi:hypothetical protein
VDKGTIMNPEQILAALAEVYAECGSYRDCGQVVTRFFHADDNPGHTNVQPFTTAFVRPDRFRFEFRDQDDEEWKRYIVWANSELIRTWWHLHDGVEQEESLALALAGATGVSGGSAHTIPALLLPAQVDGRRLTDLVRLTSLGDDLIDGITCYRLQGWFTPWPVDPVEEERRRQECLRLTGRLPERAEMGPLTMWIDRGTLLVRRIEEQVRFETFRTEDVTTYEPAVGIHISESELRFDPPEGGGGSGLPPPPNKQ